MRLKGESFIPQQLVRWCNVFTTTLLPFKFVAKVLNWPFQCGNCCVFSNCGFYLLVLCGLSYEGILTNMWSLRILCGQYKLYVLS